MNLKQYIELKDPNTIWRISSEETKNMLDEAVNKIKELETKIIKMNKDFGCELRDPNGTIWEHANNLQIENKQLREAMKQK